MGRCIILKKINKILLLLYFLVCIFSLFFCIQFSNINERNINVECIPNENIAISVAKIIIETVYPHIEYEKYSWKCFFNENKNSIYDENVWVVFCSSGNSTLGGGLPEIHIKKDTGEVVFIGLMA